MIRPADSAASRSSGYARLVAVALLLSLAYVVLAGGTIIAELNPWYWLVGASIAGACTVAYVIQAPSAADTLDRSVLVALLLFLAAATLSRTPRQSFDAALLVLAYAAGLFVARGLLAAPDARGRLLQTLMILSATLTILVAARWIPVYVEWWSLTGGLIPPLDLAFIATPWGHRYDLVLALALLYPSWWVGPGSSLRRATGTVIGVLVLVILVLTGSRALWLAVAIASLGLLLPYVLMAWRRRPGSRLWLVAGTGVIGTISVLSGVWPVLASRATHLETLSSRTAMWGPLVEVWASHPLAGYGPGSMPWILQQTDYYLSNSWEPRHPDSVPVQLLAEAGLLGLAAVAVLLVSVAAGMRRAPTGARWALIVFGLASLLASPTEFPFIMAIVLAWFAFAFPRTADPASALVAPTSALRVATTAALAIIAAAYLATVVGAHHYDRARSLIDQKQLAEAREAIDAAATLDPSLAIYTRQRGTLAYLAGDAPAAIDDLRQATELNPSDDLAWRTLALAYEMEGQLDESGGALVEAMDRQRSDVTNVLLYVRWLGLVNRTEEATPLLVQLVQSTPAIVAAPGWDDFVPDGLETDEILAIAAEEWAMAPRSQQLPVDLGLWIGILSGRDDLVDRILAQVGEDEPIANATIALLNCGDADTLLASVTESAKRSQEYWSLRLWADAAAGRSTDLTWRVLAIMRGDFDSISGALSVLNPLNENAATSADVWGYRRYPIHWPDGPFGLPAPAAGIRFWLTDSVGAAGESGLADRLPGCG